MYIELLVSHGMMQHHVLTVTEIWWDWSRFTESGACWFTIRGELQTVTNLLCVKINVLLACSNWPWAGYTQIWIESLQWTVFIKWCQANSFQSSQVGEFFWKLFGRNLALYVKTEQTECCVAWTTSVEVPSVMEKWQDTGWTFKKVSLRCNAKNVILKMIT